MIKFTAAATILFGLIISIICYYTLGFETALSSFVGAIIMTVNLAGLWFLWSYIFLKKSIALVVLIIIFKYLIFGLILWGLIQTQWIRPLGLFLGLSSLVLGILSTLVLKKNR